MAQRHLTVSPETFNRISDHMNKMRIHNRQRFLDSHFNRYFNSPETRTIEERTVENRTLKLQLATSRVVTNPFKK